MFAEGETELRDLIVQNLETTGVLNKIKAELRAGVFLALEEEGNLREKIPIFNKKFDDFINTNNGKLALSIVHEFLEYFNLNFTLSVFNPEVANTTPYIERSELYKQLNMNECDGPVLSSLLERKSGPEVHQSDSTIKRHLDSISENFLANENCVKDESSKRTISSTISEVSKSHNENYEIRSTEKSFTSSVTDDEIFVNVKTADERQSSVETGSEIDSIPNENKFANSSFSVNNQNSSSNIDSFFDEPVPSEKPSFLNLCDGFLGQNKLANPLTTEKNDLISLRNLPSLTSTANKESLPKITAASSGKDSFKKDLDLESSEELSDRQMNSEESIEEEIEEDYSAGIEDLLNSSLSAADDATSDQTISQTSVVEGVDHIEKL